jgi:hypothetical protein
VHFVFLIYYIIVLSLRLFGRPAINLGCTSTVQKISVEDDSVFLSRQNNNKNLRAHPHPYSIATFFLRDFGSTNIFS